MSAETELLKVMANPGPAPAGAVTRIRMTMRSESKRRKAAGATLLTPRQAQVIACMVAGLAQKEIAAKLNISIRCVKFHAEQIYRRYGVRDRESLLLKFGRFEIAVRWVATPEGERVAGTSMYPATPGRSCIHPLLELGGTQ